MVKVTKEPDEAQYGSERCIRCDVQTKFWWRDGEEPLCRNCASNMTNAEVQQVVEEG